MRRARLPALVSTPGKSNMRRYEALSYRQYSNLSGLSGSDVPYPALSGRFRRCRHGQEAVRPKAGRRDVECGALLFQCASAETSARVAKYQTMRDEARTFFSAVGRALASFPPEKAGRIGHANCKVINFDYQNGLFEFVLQTLTVQIGMNCWGIARVRTIWTWPLVVPRSKANKINRVSAVVGRRGAQRRSGDVVGAIAGRRGRGGARGRASGAVSDQTGGDAGRESFE